MDRGQLEVCLIVQLYPNQPAGESCPVDARNNLHDGEATMSVGPHRRLHERRRGPARTREIGIFKSPFQVVLPHSEQYDEQDACKEETNDICVLQNTWETCQVRKTDDSRGFFQPSRTVGVSPRTNTIRIRPQVMRVAPIQSTRLSSSVDGSSSSITKNPKTKHAKVKPDNKYKGLLQVGLQRSQKRKLVIRTCIHPYLVNCVRMLLRTVLKAAPIGAPAEKVAKAIERDGPGGNAFDRMPS